MFTGIVEEIGTVRDVRTHGRTPKGGGALVVGGRPEAGGALTGAARLVIGCQTVLERIAIGDSVNVNGCCLTVTARARDRFSTDLMGETLERTALGRLRAGQAVNLERPLRADGRLGGHLVQGHVDAVTSVTAVEPRTSSVVMTFALPAGLRTYIVEKGSVAVDGTSLTVMAVDEQSFQVGLIPHTLAVTVLGRRKIGDAVNVEVDVIAKYVEQMLRAGVASAYTDPRPSRAEGS